MQYPCKWPTTGYDHYLLLYVIAQICKAFERLVLWSGSKSKHSNGKCRNAKCETKMLFPPNLNLDGLHLAPCRIACRTFSNLVQVQNYPIASDHSSHHLGPSLWIRNFFLFHSFQCCKKKPVTLRRCVREAPLKLAPPLFGHCPNSYCIPPPCT